MNNIFRLCCLLVVIFTFPSCGKSRLSKEKLIGFINKSDKLNQKVVIHGVKVEVRYCPYQLFVSQELGERTKDSAVINRLEKKYERQRYFRASFSKDNKEVLSQLGDFGVYSKMVRVMSFELGKYISATNEKNETLSLLDYAVERSYGISGSNDVLLVFSSGDVQKSGQFQINLSEFGLGTGNLQFVFNKKDIENVPILIY